MTILAAPVDVEELVTGDVLDRPVAAVFGCFPADRDDVLRARAPVTMLLVPILPSSRRSPFSAFGINRLAPVSKIDQFNYVTTPVITPLFLVAGTFFPIDQLPLWFSDRGPVQPALPARSVGARCLLGMEAVDALRFLGLLTLAFVPSGESRSTASPNASSFD